VILSPDYSISASDVEQAIGPAGSAPRGSLYRPGVPFKVLADEAERAIIEEALTHHGKQMTATARALGLERSHLYKKAKALGLRGESDKGDGDKGDD
jgi:DNA-binding NtrC family response regulator